VLCRVQGIGFIIQSDKFDAAHLALQVELFVQQTLKRIASLAEVRRTNRPLLGASLRQQAPSASLLPQRTWLPSHLSGVKAHQRHSERHAHELFCVCIRCVPLMPRSLLASAAGLLHPTPVPQDEFTAGVSELCKAKLEKPKRLSELAGRWWNEIYAGTYLFDRQVRPTALGSMAPHLAACSHGCCLTMQCRRLL
jgi:hypothetical protein